MAASPASGPVRHLLVATDFSDTAQAAVAWAVEIARGHGAKVTLVHAVDLPGPVADYGLVPKDVSAELQEAALARLGEAEEPIRQAGVETASHLLLGLPSVAILEAAGQLAPDLLVLGSRGLSGFRHLLLGSTAARVVQRASCPVLTVHPEDTGRHRPIRTILVPTDFSEDARLAAGAARHLLHKLEEKARLILLHAYHLPVEYTAYGTIPTSWSYLQKFASDAEELLAKEAEGLGSQDLPIETVSREGYAPEVILQEAEARGADIIAMGTHGHTGLAHLLMGSTAERVVQHAPCPVLTVRRPRGE